jgi:hypothetical protein
MVCLQFTDSVKLSEWFHGKDYYIILLNVSQEDNYKPPTINLS